MKIQEWVNMEKTNIGTKDTPGKVCLILETQNPSTGTRDSAESRTSSPPMSINKTKFSILELVTPDCPRKCSNRVTSKSSVSTRARFVSRPWPKSIKKRKELNTRKWTSRPWTSMRDNSTPSSTRLLSTQSW